MTAEQSQGQRGQSQAQSQGGESGLWGNDAPRASGRGDEQARPADEAASTAGTRFGDFDTGRPQNMPKPAREDEERVRRQAVVQEGEGGFGYGADGETEMADAPDATEPEAEAEDIPQAGAPVSADRPHRHHPDEAKQAYFNR